MNANTKRRFEDKIAIVTGAGKGIGEQIAWDLSMEGATVILVDIDNANIVSLKERIKSGGGKCLALQCDVSSSKQVEKMVNLSLDTFSKIDLLVNNAGILITGGLEDVTDEMLDKMLDINLKGVIYLSRSVVPIMKKSNYGRIVNIASICGMRGDNTTVPCYGASKGGVIAFTRSLARELAPYGITSNAIAPHAIMTELMSYWTEEKKKSAREKIPVNRLGTTKDVSWLTLFLLSDESSFITGETINLNGGYYMN